MHVYSKVILNLMHLGYTILTEETVKGPKHKLKPKDRPEEKYEVSRWTPLVQDIADVRGWGWGGGRGGAVIFNLSFEYCLCS